MDRRTVVRFLAATYVAGATGLGVVAFWPHADRLGVYQVLWALCLPTSLLSGPLYFITIVAAAQVLGDDSVWVLNILWWTMVAACQVWLLAATTRLVRSLVGLLRGRPSADCPR